MVARPGPHGATWPRGVRGGLLSPLGLLEGSVWLGAAGRASQRGKPASSSSVLSGFSPLASADLHLIQLIAEQNKAQGKPF